VDNIQQATRGAARILCTLARRGKAIEQDTPARAELLLSAVRSHPLYKGGRLAFDMLEIEDLMLGGSPPDSVSISQLAELRNAGLHNIVAVLRRFGSGVQVAADPEEKLANEVDAVLSPEATPLKQSHNDLPRLSFGSPHNGSPDGYASKAQYDGAQSFQYEPQLKSSDYLYDYVVLGLFDAVGALT
jgi:hypothetical protein